VLSIIVDRQAPFTLSHWSSYCARILSLRYEIAIATPSGEVGPLLLTQRLPVLGQPGMQN